MIDIEHKKAVYSFVTACKLLQSLNDKYMLMIGHDGLRLHVKGDYENSIAGADTIWIEGVKPQLEISK